MVFFPLTPKIASITRLYSNLDKGDFNPASINVSPSFRFVPIRSGTLFIKVKLLLTRKLGILFVPLVGVNGKNKSRRCQFSFNRRWPKFDNSNVKSKFNR